MNFSHQPVNMHLTDGPAVAQAVPGTLERKMIETHFPLTVVIWKMRLTHIESRLLQDQCYTVKSKRALSHQTQSNFCSGSLMSTRSLFLFSLHPSAFCNSTKTLHNPVF